MSLNKLSNWQAPPVAAPQLKLLQQLSEASAISGSEHAVRKIVLKQITPYIDDIQIDPMGNLLAIKHGSSPSLPRVMLAAHMDEVGMMLTHDDGKGLFRFDIVGGIDPRQLPGNPV
ncbi:MAG: hypothetical protein OEZ02_07845, partial [Anaerolineae bacterium]|nr:hypothetical protein [Anaerolineae bacterium]